MPTAIQHSRLMSGGAHCDLALAVGAGGPLDPATEDEAEDGEDGGGVGGTGQL